MATFTLKYKLKKEFLHFLHEENIYNDFLYMLKNYSVWNPHSFVHYFDYVDARMYLSNMFRYSYQNAEAFPYKLFVEKRKIWEYYYALWEINLLIIDDVSFEDKEFILHDIYNRGLGFKYQNTLYINQHFIDKLSSIIDIYSKKYKQFFKKTSDLESISYLIESLKYELHKKENNIQEKITWEDNNE